MKELPNIITEPEDYNFLIGGVVKHGHGDQLSQYVVLHGNDFVHRDTLNVNAEIARIRGAKGRPGNELSRKQQRKKKANKY